MRLWHKDLLEVLPRQQLLGQWRECCLIARQINVLGRPNHILVNRIMDYPLWHFIVYAEKVHSVMKSRGMRCDFDKFMRYFPDEMEVEAVDRNLPLIFPKWHSIEYLDICYYNLKEKHQCGGVPEDEWVKFERTYCYLKQKDSSWIFQL